MWSMEPYFPWSNSTERAIRELKKGTARKLTWSGAPKWLWCFALEYELHVCSHTAHDIYHLDDHIPETIVLGKLLTLAHSADLAFGTRLNSGTKGLHIS